MKTVLLMVPDLLFGVKVANIVTHSGGRPRPARGEEDFLQALSAERPAAAVLDLNRGVDLSHLIGAAAGANVPVFAFISHTDAEGVGRARAAGATKVVSNGGMAGALPGWLQKVLAEDEVTGFNTEDTEGTEGVGSSRGGSGL